MSPHPRTHHPDDGSRPDGSARRPDQARRRRPRAGAAALLGAGATAGLLVLTGCSADGGQAPTTTTEPAPVSAPPASGTPGPGPAAAPTTTGAVTAAADATDVVTGLAAPWSVVRLDSGSSLVSLRDEGSVLEVLDDGGTREVGAVEGVDDRGEGGLLGLAVLQGDPSYLYAYVTTAGDNRVVRMPLAGEAGSYSLGDRQDVLTGIPKAANHDGGRIAFGPDGMLYVTTGDASVTANAQDPESLGGKILRLTPEGAVPDDNPTAGSPVWSRGHRNPQGLAWTADGTLWAAEFGQDTWDELNRIEPGANYGWPEVEGGGEGADADGFTAPVLQWTTDEASPSGLTAVGSTLYLAGLGGERLFEIQPDGSGAASSTELFTGDSSLGRVRDVLPGPDGTLWLVTNNTDGRGHPRADDDRIVSVPVTPVA